MNPTLVDLFCGSGGLSYGFQKSGFNVALGIDNWNDALATFSNTHLSSIGVLDNLATADPASIHRLHSKKMKDVAIIVGGPPCQGFSISGKREIDDPRNQLYLGFVRFVQYFRPPVFVMENVPNLVAMGKGLVKDKILDDFTKLGYKVSYKVLLASNYGVPQNRKRAFLVGSTDKCFDFSRLTQSKLVTVEEAIADLPEDAVEEGSHYPSSSMSAYQSLMRTKSSGIFNHEITQHTQKTKDIIALVPDGGNYKNLPIELQQTRKVNIAWTRLNSQKPSFTIDTGHRHHFHYKYNRVPTVRESARIQSFPDTFVFSGKKTSQYSQVGNAVPPLLAQEIARQVREQYGL